MTTIWLDGQWLDRDSAKISVFDHGLLYGDGIFEGIRVYGGKVFRLAEHMDRLYASARAINLDIKLPKAEFTALVEEGVKRSGLREAYIRPLVTRGVGDLGIDPKNCAKPTVMIIVDTIRIWAEDRYEKGLACVTAATPIPHRESLSPRVKSLNYLPHVLAKMEGNVAGADEILMMDSSGHVCEGSGQNLFVVNRRTLRTPPPTAGILVGVTRNAVMELAEHAGYSVREEMLNRYDVYTADEAFLTGTASEIVGIRSLDGRTIGIGKPGPITRDLTARFRELVRADHPRELPGVEGRVAKVES
jgi:branched-chain amino acid aminotransferase